MAPVVTTFLSMTNNGSNLPVSALSLTSSLHILIDISWDRAITIRKIYLCFKRLKNYLKKMFMIARL